MKKAFFICFICLLMLPFSLLAKDSLVALNALMDSHRWDIEGLGLYLKPEKISSEDFSLPTQYDWGLRLKGIYHITQAKAFEIRWSHYRDSADNLTHDVINYYDEGQTFIQYGYATYFDIINIEMAEYWDVYERWMLRFHAGLQLFDMSRDYHFIHTTARTQSLLEKINRAKRFGAGGVIGLDLAYELTPKLLFYLDNEFMVVSTDGKARDFTLTLDRRAGGSITGGSETRYPITGADVGVEMTVGLKYVSHFEAAELNIVVGWTGIIYTQDDFKWGGVLFGAKWVGDA